VQRLVGCSAAAQRAILLAAATYTGEDAARMGFVQRLGTLNDAVIWATAIADLARCRSPATAGAGAPRRRRAIAEASPGVAQRRRLRSPKAFLEKRRPWFTGN